MTNIIVKIPLCLFQIPMRALNTKKPETSIEPEHRFHQNVLELWQNFYISTVGLLNCYDVWPALICFVFVLFYLLFFFIWFVSLVLLGCFPVRNNWFHRQFSNFLQAKSKENINPFMILLKDATLIPFSDKPLWFKPWKRFLKAYNRASFGNFTVSLEEK